MGCEKCEWTGYSIGMIPCICVEEEKIAVGTGALSVTKMITDEEIFIGDFIYKKESGLATKCREDGIFIGCAIDISNKNIVSVICVT